jgi:general secretion pathway protein G
MTMQDSDPYKCPQCDATVPRTLRYCPTCYAPLKGQQTSRTHLEAVKKIATTHRPDPTVIFLPEVSEALRVRRVRRKRLLITGVVSLLIIVALAFGLYEWNRRQQVNKRAMARQEAARKELRMLANGLENFRTDMGRYPTEREGLESLTNRAKVSQIEGLPGAYYWLGPYVEGVYELDPWGNDYHYQVSKDGQAFELSSDGPEGLDGAQFRITSEPRAD